MAKPKPEKLTRKERTRRSASRLDDVTLDRAWEAALRGDLDVAEKILSAASPTEILDDTISWRDSSYFLFGRKPYKRS